MPLSVPDFPQLSVPMDISWLHGKLLVAGLIQALIAAGSASCPWGFPIGNATLFSPLPLVGNVPDDDIPCPSNHSLDRHAMVLTKLAEHITKTRGGAQEGQITNGKTHDCCLPDGLSQRLWGGSLLLPYGSMPVNRAAVKNSPSRPHALRPLRQRRLFSLCSTGSSRLVFLLLFSFGTRSNWVHTRRSALK